MNAFDYNSALIDRITAREAEADAENDARVSDILNAAEDLYRALREIVHEFHDTYDAECDITGYWTGAASISVATMRRAEAALKKAECR